MLALDTYLVSDLTPITSLRKLTELNLFADQASDITPIASLRNLRVLRLGTGQVSDITTISSMVNLTELALLTHQTGDISPLSRLTNLTELVLVENKSIKEQQIAKLSEDLPDCNIIPISILSWLQAPAYTSDHTLAYDSDYFIDAFYKRRRGVIVIYKPVSKIPASDELNTLIERVEDRLVGLGFPDAYVETPGTYNIRVVFPGVSEVEQEIIDDIVALYELTFVDEDGNILVTGDDVKHADILSLRGDMSPNYFSLDPSGTYAVTLSFKGLGKEKLANATKANVGKCLYIFRDEVLLSDPIVKEVIDSGEGMITGDFNRQSARYLADQINKGVLQFAYSVVSVELGLFMKDGPSS